MVYSRTQIGGFLFVAVGLGVIAVRAFGVPLGALLLIGLVLCFPLVVRGRHGREPGRDSGANRPSRPGDGR